MFRPHIVRTVFLKLFDETGSEVIEFGLVLLPLMAFVFLIMDVAWICFAQASLQHAVQVGVRTAITSYVPTDAKGNPLPQDSYIKSVVQSNAMGFLAGDSGLAKVAINYYSPSNLSKPVTGTGSNAGGNVIEIQITNVAVSALGPIFRTEMPSLALNASCSDVMESSPNGSPPSR